MLVETRGFSWYQFKADPRNRVVTSSSQLEEMIRFLDDRPLIAFDFETSGLDWFKKAQAVGLAFTSHVKSETHERNYYVPFRHLSGQKQLDPAQVLGATKHLFECREKAKVGHNIMFDEHFLRKEGIDLLGPRHDTSVLAHLFDENLPIGLKYRGVHDLGEKDAADSDAMIQHELGRLAKCQGMTKTKYVEAYGYAGLEIHLAGKYACQDTRLTYKLFEKYTQLGVLDYFAKIYATEMALTEVIGEMEWTGVPIDIPYLEDLHVRMMRDQEQAKENFFKVARINEFNLGSDHDVADYLIKGLKLPLHKKTKESMSVDDEVLVEFMPQAPQLKYLRRWRECKKITSTYTKSLIEKADENGILHLDFQQLGTVSGRCSARKPNLQNIPSDNKERMSESVRRAFIVHAGLCRLFGDYSQIELRVLAFLSQDPGLMGAYRDGRDIHNEVELRVFGTGKGTEKGPINRTPSKILNFGTTYGQTPRGLAKAINKSIEECEDIHRRYNTEFSGVASCRQAFWQHCRQNQLGPYNWFQNLFGRARRIVGLLSDDQYERARAERTAFASLVQGTAAELTKETMVRWFHFLRDNGCETKIVLSIHDEISTDGPKSEIQFLARKFKKLAEDYPVFSPVPIIMEFHMTETDWSAKQELHVDSDPKA